MKLDFLKRTQIKFLENSTSGAELLRADGRTYRQTDRQTDTTKLTVAFRNFVNAPKKSISRYNFFKLYENSSLCTR